MSNPLYRKIYFFTRCLLAICVSLFLCGPVSAADDHRITDIRFWQSPEEAQIVLDLSWTPKVSAVGTLDDGTLYFDIEGGSFRPGRQNYALNNAFISTLTVQERASGFVRIFFRVPAGIQFRTFLLPQTPPSKPDRIVIFLSEPAAASTQRREEEVAEISRLKSQNVKIVVIDPGHGGEDPGASHNGIIEKDYVLSMGKLIKAYFDRDPAYRAVLTRSGDYIIPLQRRSQIAEQAGADAFVSVHANYNSRHSVRGIEIYYESPKGAVGEAERKLVDAENQQDIIGGVSAVPHSDQAKKELVEKQASVMFRSRQLADKVETHLSRAIPGLPSRGVKRAGFRVLHSVAMPSALVEVGYMSNTTDAWYLKDVNGRQRIAQAIYQGIKDFLEGNIQQGYDTGYLQYSREVEEAKRVRLEHIRQAKERRARLMRGSKLIKAAKGDTISGIAHRYKVTTADLCEINDFGKRKKFKGGESIRIPGHD
ncbi:MAG: N-acetylmuramoyl-L-alanine amidase [Candidatus Riflebacteria bacterium]|nr:N-acetylmuramoyl-L-alanine amidase [Candidatus Riflebacteria bacterium]